MGKLMSLIKKSEMSEILIRLLNHIIRLVTKLTALSLPVLKACDSHVK